jgi:hypothetical protein
LRNSDEILLALRAFAVNHGLQAIARVTELHPNYLSGVVSGQRKPSRATLGKLRLGLARLKARQMDGTFNDVTAYRAVLGLCALRLGADPGAVQASEPDAKQTQNLDWLAAAKARRLAQYLLSITLGASQAEVARIVGVTRQAVSLACREVEDWRDDPAKDALISELELALLGHSSGVTVAGSVADAA